MASALVRESRLNPPSTAEVIVTAPGTFTPREYHAGMLSLDHNHYPKGFKTVEEGSERSPA